MPRRKRPLWLDLLILAAIPATLAAIYVAQRDATRPDRDLIRQGGGEPRYVAVQWLRCRAYPGQPPRRERLTATRNLGGPPAVEHRQRLEIVARRDGWALAGIAGETCWLPEWALAAAEPEWLPCDRRGADYYKALPTGWEEPPPALGRPGGRC